MGARKLPSYCLHRPTGQAYVTIPGPPKRVVYLGLYGSSASRRKYDQTLADWLGGERKPSRPSGGGSTVAEVVERFRRHAAAYYRKDGKPTSEVGLIGTTLGLAVDLFGDEAAASFGPSHLKAVRERLVASGLSRKGVNRRVALIVRAFGWAVDEELITAQWQAMRAVKGLKRDRTAAPETDPVEPAADELVAAALPHMSPPIAAMVRLQLVTGMRPGEACSMRLADLDRSQAVWTYRPARHKTEHHGRARVVPLGPKAQEILRPFLRRPRRPSILAARLDGAEDGGFARGQKVQGPAQPGRSVEARPQGAHPRSVRRQHLSPGRPASLRPSVPPPAGCSDPAAWRKAHRWHPNQLRHAYATRVRRDFGLEAAQVLLGHSRADVTQIYADRDFAAASRIASKVG